MTNLRSLHDALASYFTAALEAGRDKRDVPAALVKEIRQFLVDNNITTDASGATDDLRAAVSKAPDTFEEFVS